MFAIRAQLYDFSCKILRNLFAQITDPPILPPDRFRNAALFENAWQELATEANKLFQEPDAVPSFGDIMPEQEELSSYGNKSWRLFVVKSYGYTVPKARSEATQLSALLDKAPEVLSAAYSWIPGGKIIPTHAGPFRGVLRYSLGLVVPEGPGPTQRTTLTVADKEYVLRAGHSILWDDTFPHSVENSTDRPRIVLLLDVKRDHQPLHLRITSAIVIFCAGIGSYFTLRPR